MRTRRSWRNQNRLWKELGQVGVTPAPAVVVPIRTDAEIDALPFLTERTRNQLKADAQRARMKRART